MDESEPESLFEEAKRFIEASKSCQVRVVTAESCTAGALATLLSDIPGAGDVLEGGFVSYSKSFKSSVLGIGAEFLRKKSAVNSSVAEAMARGALKQVAKAELAIAITGVCGPEKDEDGNPVGLAYVAVLNRNGEALNEELDLGQRSQGQLRGAMMRAAIQLAIALLSNKSFAQSNMLGQEKA